jgi:hypothetical protein
MPTIIYINFGQAAYAKAMAVEEGGEKLMTSKIQVYPGAEGIKAVYERSLEEKELLINCMSQGYEKVLGDYFDMEYAPRLYGKIQTQELLPDTQENRDFARGKDQKLNQVRFTHAKTSETDLIIGADWVCMISFNPDNPVAVVLEEPEMVKLIRGQYMSLWEGLK